MTHPHEVILVRHGETEWNVAGRLQGHLRDSPLTARGRSQAEALGGVLAAMGVRATTHAARTSPLGRAVETARLALGPLGLTARVEPRLVEIGVGAWAGLTRAEIELSSPGLADEGIFAFHDRSEGGERIAELALRAGAVLADLTGPVVLVTHGITQRVLAALALGREPALGGTWPPLGQGFALRVRAGRAEAWGTDGPAAWPPR